MFTREDFIKIADEAVDAVRTGNDHMIYRSVYVEFHNIASARYMRSQHNQLSDALHMVREGSLWEYLRQNTDRWGVQIYSEWFDGNIKLDLTSSTYLYREGLGLAFDGLPNTKAAILSAAKPAEFRVLDICERGTVGELIIDDRRMVLKYYFDGEIKAALKAAGLGVGPDVIENSEIFMVEDFLLGPVDMESPGGYDTACSAIGHVLGTMHSNGMYYNNIMLEHIRMGEDGDDPRLIDFEAAGCDGTQKEFDDDVSQAVVELGGNDNALKVFQSHYCKDD